MISLLHSFAKPKKKMTSLQSDNTTNKPFVIDDAITRKCIVRPCWNNNRSGTFRFVTSKGTGKATTKYINGETINGWTAAVGGDEIANGFLRAVIEAYNQHYGLTLSPTHVWLAVCQVLSPLVQQYFARNKMETDEHKTGIVIETDDPSDYAYCIQLLSEALKKQITLDDAEVLALIDRDFNDTSPVLATSRQIANLSYLQYRFHYEVEWYCGIPEVVLEGTLEDWTALPVVLKMLQKFLNPSERLECDWFDRMHTILVRFADTFAYSHGLDQDPVKEGNIKTWWTSIMDYNTAGCPSDDSFHGWLADFCRISDNKIVLLQDVPAGVSAVPFDLVPVSSNVAVHMVAKSGFITIGYNTTTNHVRPIIGYMVGTCGPNT